MKTKRTKIAVLSLADINNYGDMFFPYLFREELKKRLPDAEIRLYTNVACHSVLYDTQKYDRKLLGDYDAIILAGGETIHLWDEEQWSNLYPDAGDGNISDIAFDWLTLDKPFKAYFSVGVHPNMQGHKQEALCAMNRLNYLSVRGELSKKILEGAIISHSNEIRIVPDLGWIFNQYIDRWEQEGKGKTALPQTPYMIFEMFYEFDENTLQFAAGALARFQEATGVRVVLLPIVQTKSTQALSSWNDFYPLSRLQEYAEGAFLLMPDQLDIFDLGRLLKHAKFYLGDSMHGAVTCLAYGKPAGNVLTWTAPKLQDVHGMRMRADCFITHWGRLPKLLDALNAEAEDEKAARYAAKYADYMRYRLSVEIELLCRQLTGNDK